MTSVLITQCLQRDFVAPVDRFSPLPNLLHVGSEEARRLLGPVPAEGPVARLMAWAYAQPDQILRLIHIRDWHDGRDPGQVEHFRQFGAHCLQHTEGASMVFDEPSNHGKTVAVIDSPTLNDFLDTDLESRLAACTPARFGLVGVWTEAKVSFLAYELRCRFPTTPIAVCSALTASSSRARHFVALEQLQRLLGVTVIDSPGDFMAFLGATESSQPLPMGSVEPRITLPPQFEIDADDRRLLAYLFRDCSEVVARPLAGGYSGNLVLACDSVDVERRRQVPHVVKIGQRQDIGRERVAFERIEQVLGNSAPRIHDFADCHDRGGIKYRYASMGGGSTTTFQKRYMDGMPLAQVQAVLAAVFGEHLGRLYVSTQRQARDLFDYYEFSSRWAPAVRQRVEALIDGVNGNTTTGATLSLSGGIEVPNLCHFYEETLNRLPRHPGRSWWFGWVHGDLNGANILMDAHDNVWLVDFFHTHQGHILKDLIKLENDLLYIWTPLADAADLRRASALTDALLAVADLAAPLPTAGDVGIEGAQLVRAWESVRALRAFYPALLQSDRDPLQLLIAQLRYAVHTMGFDECSKWQKRWALITAARVADKLAHRLDRDLRLRIDWIAQAPNLGITLLPGRRDMGRDLDADLAALADEGVTHVLSLLTDDELARYGVGDLPAALQRGGFVHLQEPLLDQQGALPEQFDRLTDWVSQAVTGGGRVVLHCVAGLGRSGMVAAACLVRHAGLDAADALVAVRACRSARAVETAAQEAALGAYAAHCTVTLMAASSTRRR